jgi:hypothetical protein
MWFSNQHLVCIYCYLLVCDMTNPFNLSWFYQPHNINWSIQIVILLVMFKFIQFPVPVDVCYVTAELQVWWLGVGLSSAVDQWTFMRALTGTDQLMLIQISVPRHQFRDMNSETAKYFWVFGSLKLSTGFCIFCSQSLIDNDRYYLNIE